LLPDEDDLPPRVTSGVPRELDQLPLDEDAPLDRDFRAASQDEAPGEGGRKKRRRRGSRGGRRRKTQLSDGRIDRAPVADAPADIEAIPGEEDDLPILREIGDALEPVTSDSDRAGPGGRSRRGKKRGGEKRPATGVDPDDEDLPVIPESAAHLDDPRQRDGSRGTTRRW
jgi:hypothetical protein